MASSHATPASYGEKEEEVPQRKKQGRGISWGNSEILDLLSIWGEARFQTRLSESHRNLHVFKDVAAEMVKRGHLRTSEECRTKTKNLRAEYRRVINYNKLSGKAPVTCPYFKELDNILHGDASVVPNRLSRSFDFGREEQEAGSSGATQASDTAPSEVDEEGPRGSNLNISQFLEEDAHNQNETEADDETIDLPMTVTEAGADTEIGTGAKGGSNDQISRKPESSDEGTGAEGRGNDQIAGRPKSPEEGIRNVRQPAVTQSPNTSLLNSSSRSWRARRGDHIMQNANEQARLVSEGQQSMSDQISGGMANEANVGKQIVEILKENAVASQRDRREIIDCLHALMDLIKSQKGDQSDNSPTVSAPQNPLPQQRNYATPTSFFRGTMLRRKKRKMAGKNPSSGIALPAEVAIPPADFTQVGDPEAGPNACPSVVVELEEQSLQVLPVRGRHRKRKEIYSS